MPRRQTSLAFTVPVTAALVLGAGVIAVVLALQGAPTALVVGTVLAAVPVGPLVAVYLWLDRYEPEPRTLLLLAFGWGAFVATSLALLMQLVAGLLGVGETASTAVVAPVTEEATKGLFVLLLLWFRRRELDGVLDGLVYAGLVGIGFAFVENILYLSSAFAGDDGQPGGIGGALGLFLMRCVLSPFAHPFFTSFIGLGVGVAIASSSGLVRLGAPVLGYVLAVAAHAAWNGSLVVDDGANALATYVFLMVPAFLLLAALAAWVRTRERRVLSAALDDCVGRGFLRADEVPWVVSLAARRTARAHAARVGGAAARDAVAAFQREAVELGFLHHRYLRGTPPDGFARMGQQHVDALHELRPAVLWPPSAGAPPVGVPAASRAPSDPGRGRR